MAEIIKSPNLLLYFNLLAIIIPLANSLYFNYPNFGAEYLSNITFERALAENESITLAKPGILAGRATYFEPMKLWDNVTGRVADFSTRFTFVIDSENQTNYADGMAFFLARQGYKLNTTAVDTTGGSLGLIEDRQNQSASKENSFVAVEFDIYTNEYDPVGAHVGIDINSMKSIAHVPWLCNVMEGKKNEALVVYNSTTQYLSVNFTSFRGDVEIWQFLTRKVDLMSLLPEEVTFGFSASTGGWTASHTLLSWEFRSIMLEVSGQASSAPPISSLAPQSDGQKKRKFGLKLGLGIGGGFLVLVCGLLVFYFGLWKKKIFKRDNMASDEEIQMKDTAVYRNGKGKAQMRDNKALDEEFQKGTLPKRFSYKKLARATRDFQDCLGQGGFGGVYKGFLSDLNAYVAVKRSKRSKRSDQESDHGMKQYKAEVNIIGQLKHKNLVKLIGWCHEKSDLLLVYEYMSKGSLDSHLFKENYSLLIWENRYKIAQGLASALLYLHEGWYQCVLHRDIKPSNVLLDSKFNAILGDFGLARIMDHSKEAQTVTHASGTLGYRAPEYVNTSKASKETDVYSYGIVCLELACGRKRTKSNGPEDQIDLVEWVWGLYGARKILEAADPRLVNDNGRDFDAPRMECLMVIGLWCAHPDYSQRPLIKDVIQVLDLKRKLPSLPPKMPEQTNNISRGFHTAPTSISCDTSNYSEGQGS